MAENKSPQAVVAVILTANSNVNGKLPKVNFVLVAVYPCKLNLFSDNAYVENSDGKIFTPTKSSSEDSGYIRAFTGDIRYWQTFNLTKYDAANQIKVYINYKGKDITIELER